jgi:hypothetical protein
MRRLIAVVSATSLAAVAVLAIVLVISACGSSTATTASTTPPPRPSGMPQGGGMGGDPSAMLGRQLDPLVQDGTISAAQQDSVVAALKDAMANVRPSAMPTDGAQPQGGGQPPDLGAMFSSALDPLVGDGTLTAAQEKAVLAALSSAPAGSSTGMQQ